MNIGERVGDYEIIDVLGAGGMGQVYKVRNMLSERIEAMKVVLPNMSSDPELAQRFLREIKVQAALDHPNIARLHTAQQFGDQLFMVMEFVDGNSLEKLLEKAPLPLGDCLSVISQVLEALAYAHARTVVHRDIKPANIMITPSGVVKLMDFGIARMQADRRLTRTGHTVGSLFYMSPEQIQGGDPDPRSDLYALGVTMYEMVTGRKPFQGDSDYSIMAAHLQQTPIPPLELVSDLPADLSEIILMAIAKDPAARFQSAEAFRAALRNVNMPVWKPLEKTATVVLPAVSAPAPVVSAPIPAAPAPVASAPMPPAPAPVAMASSVGAPVQPVSPLPPPGVGAAPFSSAPPPPSVTTQKPASRRGLYMALGSVATLVVLAAAIIEVPKFIHARAQQSAAPTSDAPSAPAPAAPATPAAVPASTDATPAPANAAPSPAAQTPAPTPTPASPVETAPTPAKAAAMPQHTPTPVAQHPRTVRPAAVQQPAADATPAPPVQAPPAQSAAPVQPPASAQAARPSATELNSLRQDYNLLSIRVSSAKAGLRSLQRQMAGQGLGLRGDMLETETRMDYQMKEAMDYIRSGDVDQARTSMQMAQRALETIEKFLGH